MEENLLGLGAMKGGKRRSSVEKKKGLEEAKNLQIGSEAWKERRCL